MNLDTLKKKQDEEFINKIRNVFQNVFQCSGYDEIQINSKISVMVLFLREVRSETAEAVAREMVGKKKKIAKLNSVRSILNIPNCINMGYNNRISEEQSKRDEIINSLKE